MAWLSFSPFMLATLSCVVGNDGHQSAQRHRMLPSAASDPFPRALDNCKWERLPVGAAYSSSSVPLKNVDVAPPCSTPPCGRTAARKARKARLPLSNCSMGDWRALRAGPFTSAGDLRWHNFRFVFGGFTGSECMAGYWHGVVDSANVPAGWPPWHVHHVHLERHLAEVPRPLTLIAGAWG